MINHGLNIAIHCENSIWKVIVPYFFLSSCLTRMIASMDTLQNNKISILSVHMAVIRMLHTWSRSFFSPLSDVSHLGGATAQKAQVKVHPALILAEWGSALWMDSKTSYGRFTFCPVAIGQSASDSDATQKTLLSKTQPDALPSKRTGFGWHLVGHSCWSCLVRRCE